MNTVADITKITFVKDASGNYVLSDEVVAYINNQIELAIDREMYFLPDDKNGIGKAAPDSPDNKTNETLTCAIKLKNRIGVYAVGRKAAFDKLRPMFEFQLAEKLYREKQAG